MNGQNGTINLDECSLLAILSLDSKGRVLIPYKIRITRKKRFGLIVTEKAIVLKDMD